MPEGFAQEVNGVAMGPVRERRPVGAAGAVVVGAGVARYYNTTGRDLKVRKVHLAVSTAPTGANGITVDVNIDGTTIFPTQAQRPVIAATAFTGEAAAPAGTVLAAGSYLTIDVDTVGGTIAGSDLVATVVLG